LLKQYAEYDFQKQGYGICRKHSAPVTSVAINAAAQIFVSGCRDGKVQMFDALSGQDVVALLRPIGEFGIYILPYSPSPIDISCSLYCKGFRFLLSLQ
jgi:hypothetical protein